jgi:HrpA-like RNA helicase
MLVAFDEPSARACTHAVRPLDAIRFTDVREACTKLSEVLPLIVLHPEHAEASTELTELAGACGAEVISVALPVDTDGLGRRILDALHKAEARRVLR